VSEDPEYHDAMIDMLELIWGRDYMAPGGAGNVANLLSDLDVKGRRVLDVGCGLGGPAFEVVNEYGAEVVGFDIDGRLVEHAERRAQELGLSDRANFKVVEPGPFPFESESFDFVISSGAITQIEDKRGVLLECFRVLRPGGWLTCYDWMRCEHEEGEGYGSDMLYWFKMEGLTYALATPSRQRNLLEEVGFQGVGVEDRSPWYREEVKREFSRISGSLHSRLLELMSSRDVEHFVENWRAMVVVCEREEMLQVYSRGQRPARDLF
jgi:ubiquinone/menaquinone biosynthesis C-methylase UbiE